MAREVLESGAAHSYEDLLDQVAAVPDRKLFNALLAVLQMPHATMLYNASEWDTKWGRRIKSEERPLVLLFPFGPVEFVYVRRRRQLGRRIRDFRTTAKGRAQTLP